MGQTYSKKKNGHLSESYWKFKFNGHPGFLLAALLESHISVVPLGPGNQEGWAGPSELLHPTPPYSQHCESSLSCF